MILPAAEVESVKIAVVIPCYRVTRHVLSVLDGIGPEVAAIYCIDDGCPDESGSLIEASCSDPRVKVIRHAKNLGVGGAVMTGYRAAIQNGCDVIVKIDGDGQMNPALLPVFVSPIVRGDADYTKGNRFYDLREIKRMPIVRRLGNLALSFMAKASTGYWDLFDPNNGYTAINAKVAAWLPFESISERYFFETDMLFRLNTLRAVVLDVPMHAHYADESSNLRVSRIFGEFLGKHFRNLFKRLLYNYFLRDLSIASIEIVACSILIPIGLVMGGLGWYHSVSTGIPAAVGTVMIPTLSIILGIQLLLSFLSYDISSVPRNTLSRRLDAAMSKREY